ncbi:MAG: PAS domain S-box protein [Deltaproteobacteria bacterium]
MKDQDKPKEQLITELKRMRQRIVELERSEKRHKQVEETLKESEEKYRALVNDASDAIMLADESGYILDTNRKMEDLLGYTREELLNKNIIQIHPEEELKRTVAVFKDIIREGSSALSNGYVLRKDGLAVPVDITGSVVRYAGKSIVQGIFRDVTERKDAEEKLRTSETKYRQLIDTLQEGVWVIDDEACTTFVNPRMAEMLGYTVDEMPGRHLFSFMDKEGVELCKVNLERRRLGIKESHDFEFLKKDGNRIYATLEAAPIFDEQGNYRGSIAGLTDITERKRVEGELNKSEEKYRNIFEKSPMGIFQSTFDGRFVDVNPALARMLGYDSPQEVIESIHNIAKQIYVNPQRRDDLVKLIKATPEAARFESQFFMKDGKKWAGKLTMRVIYDENGQPHHLDGFIEDITQQKIIEDKLQNTMKQLKTLSRRLLEVQEAERRYIARELHDEIGQVLTAVKINLQAAERSADAESSVMVPLKESIKIVDRLFQQVRSLSIELHPSILDDLGLLAALRWYIDWISRQGGMRGQFVTKFTKERLSPVFEITCFRIVQESLTNILRHAKAKNVFVELGEYNGELHLRVKDDGVGFDVRNAREKALKGKSLGLLGMEERVMLAGGRIEIKSERGLGTEIHVYLPLKFFPAGNKRGKKS